MWGLTAADFFLIAGAVMTLVVLEGLLSADNALVLALMVRHLPADQQKRALRYGIWGAFVFRFIAVIFASKLLEYWWLKVGGGAYLLYISLSHLIRGEDHHEEGEGTIRLGRGFWATVVSVEIADIAFSIDSILAAVSTSDGLPSRIGERTLWFLPVSLWIVYLGGVLGIITMRMVAGLFLRILKQFTGLATGAYVMVAWIGLHLVGGGLHMAFHPANPANVGQLSWVPGWFRDLPLEMPDWLFWTGMGVILALSLVLGRKGKPDRVEVDPASEGQGPPAGAP